MLVILLIVTQTLVIQALVEMLMHLVLVIVMLKNGGDNCLGNTVILNACTFDADPDNMV